jgi:tetratricopeptide (TPR) repeat protein
MIFTPRPAMPYTTQRGINGLYPEGSVNSMELSNLGFSSTSRIGLGLIFCLSQLGCSRGPEYYLNKGNRFYAEGKYPDAVLNYQNSIKKDGNSAEAHYRLALAELKQGASHAPAAYEKLQRAVYLAPGREDCRVELADLVLKFYSSDSSKPKILYDQLVEAAEYLLKADPNSFNGLRLRADVLALDGRFDEALAVFKKANGIKPLEPQVVLPMAQVLFRLNRTVEGETLAHRFVESRKDFGPGYDVLIDHYTQTKQMPEAEAILKSKAANLPKDSYAVIQLASFYLRLNREPAMLQSLQGILNNPKDFPRGHQIVGDFYANNGRWDQALSEYNGGLSANSKDQVLYRKKIANVFIAKGKREEAINELDQVVKSNTEDLDARLARAILLRDSTDPKRLEFAAAELNAILAKNPNDEVARYNLGLVYSAKGDHKSAHAQLVESAKLNRNYLLPRLVLAERAQKDRAYSETIRRADEVLAVDPSNSDAKFWRAAGLLGIKSYQAARLSLNALLRENPDSPNLNLHLAVLDTAEKKYREAEARFLRFYKPGDKDLRPLEGLIQLYSEQRQVEKGLKLLDGELKLAPDSRPAHLLLAATAARAGKLDLAIQQYEWLQTHDLGSVDVHASLGDVYWAKGDIQSALASYNRAREMAPNDPKVIAMIAYMEVAAGKNKEAIPNLQRQLSLDPENAETMNNLAFALAETGSDLDQALSLAEKAQRKLPNNPGVADTLGWVYTKKGLNDSAVQIFNSLIKKFPDSPVLRYHLAVALLQQGKREEAKTQLTIGLSKNPPKEMADKIKDIVAKIG